MKYLKQFEARGKKQFGSAMIKNTIEDEIAAARDSDEILEHYKELRMLFAKYYVDIKNMCYRPLLEKGVNLNDEDTQELFDEIFDKFWNDESTSIEDLNKEIELYSKMRKYNL